MAEKVARNLHFQFQLRCALRDVPSQHTDARSVRPLSPGASKTGSRDSGNDQLVRRNPPPWSRRL